MSKVFGIGLSKTGTISLHHALLVLGYKSSHLRHRDGQQIIEPKDFAHYDAGTDINVAGRLEMLDAMYPGSKFIYTVRELESWLGSVYMEFWHNPRSRGQEPGLRGLMHEHALDRVIRDTFDEPPEWRFTRAWWINAYAAHSSRVARHFRNRQDDLLVLNVCGGDGWQPLCRFLNRPVPDVPFPHEHQSGYPWRGDCHRLPEELLI